jgi:hypothetical protein
MLGHHQQRGEDRDEHCGEVVIGLAADRPLTPDEEQHSGEDGQYGPAGRDAIQDRACSTRGLPEWATQRGNVTNVEPYRPEGSDDGDEQHSDHDAEV